MRSFRFFGVVRTRRMASVVRGENKIAFARSADYCSSCSTPWGTWLAWASMACADCTRMLFLV